MFKQLRIWWLKRVALAHFRSYYRAFARYDCGFRMAEQISPTMQHHKHAFNAVMDKLSMLDPNAPMDRL